MIELTTGVALIISSLYSPAVANTATVGDVEATTTETRSFTDQKQLIAYLEKEYKDTPILIEIARCESTFRQFNSDGSVVRGRIDRDDIGVMQINERYHADTAKKLGMDIHTVEGNVAYAKVLYDKFGAEPWSASSKCWAAPKEIAVNTI